MDTLSNLALGLDLALSWEALLFCLIGVTIGTVVGVLPGVGALAAVSISLPMTFYLDPMPALIMLAGIFYGAQYGSSITSILMNLPGSPGAAATCLDGYPMARQGRAGSALFITTISSFVGGAIAITLMILFAPSLARLALQFGPAEYFAVMTLGLVAASTLGQGSVVKGLAMVILGVLLGLIGTDVSTGTNRYTFGLPQLFDGISLVALAMGLFGMAEILASLSRGHTMPPEARRVSLRGMLPTRDETRRSVLPTLRGAAVGSWFGALPGTGPTVASFMAYALEKRVSRTPERFGNGAVEGISAPESANNAAVQAAFIPTLSLGIPGDAVSALLLGAIMIQGITPGPQFIAQNPEIFWALVMSFWIGNVLLLVLNIPFIGLWVKLLSIPYHILYPGILVLICIGVYSVKNSVFDVYVCILAGLVGYAMILLRYPVAPLLLGFILGPMVEEYFRRAMLVARGDPGIFLTRPLSALFLGAAALILLAGLYSTLRRLHARRPGRDPR